MFIIYIKYIIINNKVIIKTKPNLYHFYINITFSYYLRNTCVPRANDYLWFSQPRLFASEAGRLCQSDSQVWSVLDWFLRDKSIIGGAVTSIT